VFFNPDKDKNLTAKHPTPSKFKTALIKPFTTSHQGYNENTTENNIAENCTPIK